LGAVGGGTSWGNISPWAYVKLGKTVKKVLANTNDRSVLFLNKVGYFMLSPHSVEDMRLKSRLMKLGKLTISAQASANV
jgi:hypothetical protein